MELLNNITNYTSILSIGLIITTYLKVSFHILIIISSHQIIILKQNNYLYLFNKLYQFHHEAYNLE